MSVLIAGLVLIALVYVVDWWSARKLEIGWLEYGRIMKVSGEEKWDQLKRFYADNGSMRPTYFAALTLADHYFELAKESVLKKNAEGQEMISQAVAWYTKALEFGDLLPAERQLIYIDRGNAYELQNKLDEAQKDYEMAAGFNESSKGLALMSEARVYELKKENQKAEEVYRKITVEFADTEYARLARNYLRRLKSPLFKGES